MRGPKIPSMEVVLHLATTDVSEKGKRMPVPTHVVNVVSLLLCLSLLARQNGCSNSGLRGRASPGHQSRRHPEPCFDDHERRHGHCGRWAKHRAYPHDGGERRWDAYVRRVCHLCHHRRDALSVTCGTGCPGSQSAPTRTQYPEPTVIVSPSARTRTVLRKCS